MVTKTNQLPGGKFNMSRPKSDMDWAIFRSIKQPGPQVCCAVFGMPSSCSMQCFSSLGLTFPLPFGHVCLLLDVSLLLVQDFSSLGMTFQLP